MEVIPIDSPQFALSGSCLAGAHMQYENVQLAGDRFAVSWRCCVLILIHVHTLL